MNKAIDSLFRGIQILIAIFLGAMIFLVFMNVVLRYAFSLGFAWSEEIARLCFIYLVYLGTIDAYRDNKHLGVELLVMKAGPRAQKILYLAIQLIVIWMMAVLAMGSWGLAMQSLNDRWVATGYPRWLVNIIGAVTGVAIIILAVVNIIRMFVAKTPVLELMLPKNTGDDPMAAIE